MWIVYLHHEVFRLVNLKSQVRCHSRSNLSIIKVILSQKGIESGHKDWNSNRESYIDHLTALLDLDLSDFIMPNAMSSRCCPHLIIHTMVKCD